MALVPPAGFPEARRARAILFVIAVIAVIAVPAVLAAGCKPAGGDARPDATPGPADASPDLSKLDGPALFGTLCAPCHGPTGEGYKADNAPSLVNKTFLESASDDQLRASIVQGRPGTAMAGYGKAVGGPLDDAGVAKVVAFLRSKGPEPMPIPAPAAGDALRGKKVYEAQCQSCHGTQSTRGNAVHLANPRFLEVASEGFLRHAIVNGRPGTPMVAFGAAFGGKLTEQEILDVVTYVKGLDKPPPVQLLPAPTGKEPMVINPQGKAPTFTPRADPCGPDPKCKPEPRYVSIDQVKKALEEKRRIVILDARSPSDWMRVHIPGAVSLPHYDLKRLDEVPNDGTWVVAYCACPHHLSGDVVAALKKRGYKNAVILDEGILEWHRRGYPVVAAEGVTPPPGGPPLH